MGSNVDAKLLRQTKFPPEFSKKVDMTKVNIEVMKKWIAGKLSEVLGDEDDVIIELCFNLLESSRFPDIKSLQIQLTGFLDKDTPKFCQELWNLCLSAQSSPQGVPRELLEAKKLELRQEKLDAEKAAQEARERKEKELEREREIESIRQRERADRDRGFRGGRGGRDYARRSSRSPRRRSPDRRGPPPRREFDSYVPRGGGRGRRYSRSHHLPAVHTARIDVIEDVRDPLAGLHPQVEGGTEETGDKARLTVMLEIDLLPAVIRHAHLVPEEFDDETHLPVADLVHRRHEPKSEDIALHLDQRLGGPEEMTVRNDQYLLTRETVQERIQRLILLSKASIPKMTAA
ncbi:PWI domain-containing protein [Talaromyces proteolyticus]|uniref:PWI domain-containing protein n=1 Tax=Talaromyces proteolyticus TaxID=1131652 RepID=A0AAD4PYI3_9EURO|nr:PWI domain-containing protein [Talaromyces proteolyticus]KAH8694106.1 PWI domain-containing protein [Talaromyces proteolyticus]